MSRNSVDPNQSQTWLLKANRTRPKRMCSRWLPWTECLTTSWEGPIRIRIWDRSRNLPRWALQSIHQSVMPYSGIPIAQSCSGKLSLNMSSGQMQQRRSTRQDHLTKVFQISHGSSRIGETQMGARGQLRESKQKVQIWGNQHHMESSRSMTKRDSDVQIRARVKCYRLTETRWN